MNQNGLQKLKVEAENDDFHLMVQFLVSTVRFCGGATGSRHHLRVLQLDLVPVTKLQNCGLMS